jgi:hypothetical protein
VASLVAVVVLAAGALSNGTTAPKRKGPARHTTSRASTGTASVSTISASAPGGALRSERRFRRTSLLRPNAASSFAALQDRLPGPVGIAIAPLEQHRVTVLGDDAPAHGWSTTKVPVLVALIMARGAAGLTSADQAWAQLAITESDNQSILDLFADLESVEGGLDGASGYVQDLLRESGDGRTIVATEPPPPGAVTTFGQTEWAPGEAVKFFQMLGSGCLLAPGPTHYVLNLMEHIVPSESWGLGSASFAAPVAFKGGWGPEDQDRGAYLVRQSGIIDPGSARGFAVSIVAHPPAGADSFGVGTEMVTEAAQWLARELVLAPRRGIDCAAAG